MITTYWIIQATSKVQLVQEVLIMIKNGWTPTGGLTYNSDTKEYLQAMVK